MYLSTLFLESDLHIEVRMLGIRVVAVLGFIAACSSALTDPMISVRWER